MKKVLPFALLLALAAVAPATAQATATVTAAKGQMLHAADGGRLSPVQTVESNGSVQIIYYGKVVTIPASSLSSNDGELTTSLTKNQVIAPH